MFTAAADRVAGYGLAGIVATAFVLVLGCVPVFL
ncbi:hypothetical protein LAUMK35_00986 [Mycobacterium pseudokansasii]|nr:hypothetical protein LAUMK35_00986 [Mycobacterium pseudokansasii]VAZ90355.1 hypothetical protein LAUMK21_00986 [Mycobacterium pseudokansasii]